MENINEFLGGRIINTRVLTSGQISQLLNGGGQKYSGLVKNDITLICRRCQSIVDPDQFNEEDMYCRKCINFGRLTINDEVIITSSDLVFSHQNVPMTWQGTLTNLQTTIAKEIIDSFYHSFDHLIWAVTGAGKTEIIFPLLEQIILNDKRVAICSPRIDVCIELFPRVKSAFAKTSIGLFHGRNNEKYFPSQIMISTVHQLIKFENAFDVLIIDEVDSFPLAGDPMLENAIQKAKKKNGCIIYLSATPPISLLNQVDSSKIKLSKLYRRFHNYPLPEPKCHLLLKPSFFLKINPRIRFKIKQMIKTNQRFMLFFPRIPDMLMFEKALRKYFPDLKMVSVSSKDLERLEKVQQFRDEEVTAILTTTILERGVTFHKITVIVIDADADEFSKTALIQIAGRAGRAKDHPDDEVHFYYQYFTKKISRAVFEIHQINQQAYSK